MTDSGNGRSIYMRSWGHWATEPDADGEWFEYDRWLWVFIPSKAWRRHFRRILSRWRYDGMPQGAVNLGIIAVRWGVDCKPMPESTDD